MFFQAGQGLGVADQLGDLVHLDLHGVKLIHQIIDMGSDQGLHPDHFFQIPRGDGQ